MTSLLGKQKIGCEHLDRLAMIYVRQSTLAQVRLRTASTARQYDLSQRAIDLGWSSERILVIDEDQGQSGASATERDGFQRLVAEVGMGRVGAVFSLEVSRLARSCSDWYRLIEICALTHTLVIDEEGVYDPIQYNDRLLLGFKGTMSEAELHWLRARLDGGRLERAQQGKLRFCLPTGLVHNDKGQIVLDPDEQVQEAIHLLFALFDELGSAGAVARHFATHKLLFPLRRYGGERHGELTWKPLTCERVLGVLGSPLYAGAYVYGRFRVRSVSIPGETLHVKRVYRPVSSDEWIAHIQDAHPGYITWQQFLLNRQRLQANRTCLHDTHGGAAREGKALLQGIALCGRCGRRLHVHYKEGRALSYVCPSRSADPLSKDCQSIQGERIDAVVVQALLEAMQPAQLYVSLASLEQIEERARQIDRQWTLRIEHAQYEATLARRRFYAVDPENRLVAHNLEREWNEKLDAVQCLEREYAELPRPAACLASAEERRRILALAQDFPAVWHAPTTTNAERKQLLRLLIRDVALARRKETVHIGIRWQTGAVTELDISRAKKVHETQATSPAVVERVRELAPTHSDRRIAEILNGEGLTTGVGAPFARHKVYWVRFSHHIPTGCPETHSACPGGQRGDGRYSTQAAAELLHISRSGVNKWCRNGRLDAVQDTPHGPHWIRLTPEIIAGLRKPG